MKKLFTLFALVMCFLGAKAEWVVDKSVDYSKSTAFPYYVMGYVPEWQDGVMTDLGGNYTYKKASESEEVGDLVKTTDGTEYYRFASDGTWHQYFVANDITTELDGSYTVVAMVKASEEVSIPMNMAWDWSGGSVSSSATIGTSWSEVEWTFSGIGATSCFLIVQPNTAAKIEWKWLKVKHNAKASRPVEWIEHIEGGDGSGYGTIPCAQLINKTLENETAGLDDAGVAALVKPCPIEDGVFVCKAPAIDKSAYEAAGKDGNIAWQNQFFIVLPEAIKAGEQIKVSFDYKADKATTANTQAHGFPTYYSHWQCIGDVEFTTEWQTLEKTISVASEWTSRNDGFQSIAFNLNPNIIEENTYYFKNLSISTMKLDEGYFVAGCNKEIGLEYDLDNAIELVYDEDEALYIATIGTEGDPTSYVNEIMISTVRGNDQAFKGKTISVTGTIDGDGDNWLDYKDKSLAKLTLPGKGVWKISLDTEYTSLSIAFIEGELKEIPAINPNPTVVVVNGVEREYKSGEEIPEGYVFKETKLNEETFEEEPVYGNDWDNQFCIMANRTLEEGEETVISFDYVATVPAKSGTQCGGSTAGAYVHWGCIGDVEFTEEVQHFEKTFTVPAEAKGMQSITFNLALLKGANNYTFKNIIWKLADNTESLINQEGTKNFIVKEGAGTKPYEFGTENPNAVAGVAAADAKAAVVKTVENGKVVIVKNGKKYNAVGQEL